MGKGSAATLGSSAVVKRRKVWDGDPCPWGWARPCTLHGNFCKKWEVYKILFWGKKQLADLRRASLPWDSEAGEVRPPLPPCCFSVFSCGRREFPEDCFFAEHVFIYNTVGDFHVFPGVFQAFCSSESSRAQWQRSEQSGRTGLGPSTHHVLPLAVARSKCPGPEFHNWAHSERESLWIASPSFQQSALQGIFGKWQLHPSL